MPYKNKEDRTKAVRRHRERKREQAAEQEKVKKVVFKYWDVEQGLGNFLKTCFNFEEIPFRDFVEICQDEFIVNGKGVWDRGEDKFIDEPQVLFGGNMMLVIPRAFLSSKGLDKLLAPEE